MNSLRRGSAIFLVITLLAATGCGSTADQSSVGEYIDDTVITTRVKTAIFNDPELKVAEINVETFKSVVQLSGFVSTREEVIKAGVLASSVTGVESVRNNIILK